MTTALSLISLAVLVALICDAKMEEINFLNRTRIARKIRKVQEANKATELDNLYYTQQISK